MNKDQCIIYKIHLNDRLYIGSTTNLQRREWEHNSRLKCGLERPLYKYCRQNCINEVKLVELKCVPICDRYNAEQYYIDTFRTGNNLLNDKNALLDYQARREKHTQYMRGWRQAQKMKKEQNNQ